MQDIDIEESLVQKVGGKFALTVLIQKRMIELNRGAAPLVRLEGEDRYDPRRIVTQEILEGKIELSALDEIGPALEESKPEPVAVEAPAPAPVATEAAAAGEDGEDVEIYGSDIKKIKEQRIKELSQLLNPKK